MNTFSRKLGCLPWALLWDMPIKSTVRCPSCLLRLMLWSNEKIVSSYRIWKTFCTSVEIWRDILCVVTGWLLNKMNINWPCNREIPSLCKYAKQWKHGFWLSDVGYLHLFPKQPSPFTVIQRRKEPTFLWTGKSAEKRQTKLLNGISSFSHKRIKTWNILRDEQA